MPDIIWDAMAMAQHQPALQLAQFDQALAAARQAGLNASRLRSVCQCQTGSRGRTL